MSIPRKIRLATVFTTVADEGGFRAAGRKLGLSPAQVSKGVTDMEAELGTALLYRSTRNLKLTKAAEEVLPHFRDMVDSFDRGMKLLETRSPSELRVSIPSALVAPFFTQIITEWQSMNEETRLVLDVQDDHHLRANTNTDLFIRIGGPEQDMRIARLICEVSGYLGVLAGAFPVAQTADDLRSLPLAVPLAMKSGFNWTHTKNQEQVRLGEDAVFVVNNTQMLRELLLSGQVVTPVFDFEEQTSSGHGLVENVAPEWCPGVMPVRAVYASERPILSPARDLVEFLSERLSITLRK